MGYFSVNPAVYTLCMLDEDVKIMQIVNVQQLGLLSTYLVNRTSQIVHMYGFSPVCVLMCRGSFPAP